MKRRYAVWHSSSKKTGELEAYFVTDISDDEMERHKKFIDNLDRISRIDYLAQEKFRPVWPLSPSVNCMMKVHNAVVPK